MKRKLEENEEEQISEPATKKQKIDPSFCKIGGCSRLCNPGNTKSGNKFDTCCRNCAKNGGTTKVNKIYHDFECNQRIYSLDIFHFVWCYY